MMENLNKAGVIDTSKSPLAKLKSLPLNAVQFTSGFWSNRYNTTKVNSLELLYHLMSTPELGHAVENLKIAAGLAEGVYKGVNWCDAWVYKWIESAAYFYIQSKERELYDKMDTLIDIIGAAQEEDGYIASQIAVQDPEGYVYKRFEEPRKHELYTMGHLLTAACIHHRATGSKKFLDIAIKAGDFMCNTFINMPIEYENPQNNTSNIMGLVELYRVTDKKKYLDMANVFINMHGKYEGGIEIRQNARSLREETEVLGHAVFFTYLYCGATDVYLETGDTSLYEAMLRLWKDLTQKKMYINGGVGHGFTGLIERVGEDTWGYPFSIGPQRYIEGIGKEYAMSNITAYNETCSQVGSFMWNWRLLQIDPNEKYANIMENTIYNGILSGVDLEGKGWSYTNVLRWFGKDHRLLSHDLLERIYPTTNKICCPTNVTRTIASLGNYFYSTSKNNTLWIHQYGANEMSCKLPYGQDVKIKQITDYPWQGDVGVSLELEEETEMTVMVRIPSWVKNATLSVNGQEISYETVKGYARIDALWLKSNMIHLKMDMPVRRMICNQYVEANENHMAIMRGPILYCVESVDLPDDIRISDLFIPRMAEFKVQFEKDLLCGVNTLMTTAYIYKNATPKDSLYQELEDVNFKEAKIRLVPYYSWCNRGVGEMAVWLQII